jgi:nitrogen regulatory protein PII 2
MKEVMSIIRMNMVGKTKQALLEAGYPSMTVVPVTGRGKRKVDYNVINALLDGESADSVLTNVSNEDAEVISEAHRLIPKRLIMIVAQAEDVPEIVDIITETNQTGSMGDGKIFVVPTGEAYRIRTGETDAASIL